MLEEGAASIAEETTAVVTPGAEAVDNLPQEPPTMVRISGMPADVLMGEANTLTSAGNTPTSDPNVLRGVSMLTGSIANAKSAEEAIIPGGVSAAMAGDTASMVNGQLSDTSAEASQCKHYFACPTNMQPNCSMAASVI